MLGEASCTGGVINRVHNAQDMYQPSLVAFVMLCAVCLCFMCSRFVAPLRMVATYCNHVPEPWAGRRALKDMKCGASLTGNHNHQRACRHLHNTSTHNRHITSEQIVSMHVFDVNDDGEFSNEYMMGAW